AGRFLLASIEVPELLLPAMTQRQLASPGIWTVLEQPQSFAECREAKGPMAVFAPFCAAASHPRPGSLESAPRPQLGSKRSANCRASDEWFSVRAGDQTS